MQTFLQDFHGSPDPHHPNTQPPAIPQIQWHVPDVPTSGPSTGRGRNPPKRKLPWVLVFTVLLFVVLIGGGAFAYSQGYLPLPFLPTKSNEIFEKIINQMSNVTSAEYGVGLKVKVEDRDPKAIRIFDENTNIDLRNLSSADPSTIDTFDLLVAVYNPDNFMQFIPANLDLSVDAKIYLEGGKSFRQANGQLTIHVEYRGGDITMVFDGEGRKVNEQLFARLNNVPSFPGFDPTPLKEKWIDFGSDVDEFYNDLEQLEKESANSLNFKETMKLALEKKLYTVKQKLPSEKIGEVKTDHYLIGIDHTKLVDVYEALLNKPNINGELKTTYQSVIDDLKKPPAVELMKRAAEAQQTEIWIDNKNNYIRRVKSALPLVPSDKNEQMKGKQLTVESTLNIDRINEKITVEKPTGTITVDEALTILNGGVNPKEQALASKQIANVRQIEIGLSSYFDEHAQYPEKLQDIQIFFGSSGIPVDTYTSQSFSYARSPDAKDYTLRYELREVNDSQKSSGFVSGQNIMTSKGVTAGNMQLTTDNPGTAINPLADEDQDGLTNGQEEDYGTDPKNPDSDGDGFKDGEEVKNGYNPYGPGKLPIIDLYEVEAPASTT